MMRNSFWSLVRTQINTTYGLSAMRHRFFREKKKRWEPFLILFGILVGGGSVGGLFTGMCYVIFSAGQMMGQPELVLSLAALAAMMVVLLFGIIYIMNIFYFSNDTESLLVLPLAPWKILASKFIVLMINEYLTVGLVLVPAIMVYGLKMGMGVPYYLLAIPAFLLAPVFPLSLAGLLVVVLMRFVNLRKNKDLFTFIGGLLGIGAAVGYNVLIQQMPKQQMTQNVASLLQDKQDILGQFVWMMPPVYFFTGTLSGHGLRAVAGITGLVAVSAVMLALLLVLGNRFYIRSITAGNEVTRKRRKANREEIRLQASVSGSPMKAMFLKEWRLFLRTPIFILNSVAGMIIAPFLMVMPFVTGSGAKGSGPDLRQLMHQPGAETIAAFAAVALALFACNINALAATAVSREGRLFWVSRMIPVSPVIQVNAKLMHALTVQSLGIVMTGIAAEIFLKLPAGDLVAVILLGLCGNLLLSVMNLTVDVLKPKLHWNNPQEAVKQNFNVFVTMLIDLLVMALLGVLTWMTFRLDFPDPLKFFTLAAVMLMLTVPAYLLLLGVARSSYASIEC